MPWRYDSFNDVWKKRGETTFVPHKNLAPIANFTHNAANLDAVFDGTYSYDPDGTVVGWVWNFGDGKTGTGPQIPHSYAQAGTYSVLLTVTDAQGLSASKAIAVTVTAPVIVNQKPTAKFTYTTGGSADPYRLNVDASASTDSDGNIVKYHWDFGNGAIFDSVSPVANGFYYTADGTYTVTLTVTDDNGATASQSQIVTVKQIVTPPNQNPGASFTASASGLVVSVNGGASTDPDGNITAYDWNWGDGTTHGSGVTATHTYAAAGTYSLTLTVTDNSGGTNALTKSVSPTNTTNTPYVIDDGLGTNGGLEPTGRVSYGTVAGANLARKAQAAGNIMSVPPGTFILPGFVADPNSADHHVFSSKGFIGSGSSKTIVTMTQATSSGAAFTSNTNPYNILRFDNTTGGGLLADATILGTPQSITDNSGVYALPTIPHAKADNTYNGLIITGNDWTLNRVKMDAAGPGSYQAPPGETFGISAFKAYGTLTLNDVEINGRGRGASGLGLNGSGTAATVPTTLLRVTRLWTHGNEFSGGIAFWQTVFDVNSFMDDCVFDDDRCLWNVERCSGTVTLNRPRIGVWKSWPTASDWASGTAATAVGIFAEADATWGATAAQNFRWIVRDPRNKDGSPYSGPPLPVTFGNANDKGTNYYGRTNFKCYNAAGVDISSSFYAYGGKPFN